MAVTFTFSEQISSKLLQKILDRAGTRLPSIGFNSQLSDFQITVQPGQAVPLMPVGIGPNGQIMQANFTGGIPGRTFQSSSHDGIEEEVLLRANMFSFFTTKYDRWSVFLDRVTGIFSDPLENALSVVDLSQVKLEYWDRFVCISQISDTNYAQIFNFDSKYMPRFPLNSTEMWHAHIGYFLPSTTSKRRLVNLNFDMVEVIEAAPAPGANVYPKRSAGIYSMAQDDIRPKQVNDLPSLLPILRESHATLLDLMRDIIVPPMATKIGLPGGEQ